MSVISCPHCQQTFAGSPEEGGLCPLCGRKIDALPSERPALMSGAPPGSAPPPLPTGVGYGRPAAKKGNGLAVAGMVLGILSLLLGGIVGFSPYPWLLGAVAVPCIITGLALSGSGIGRSRVTRTGGGMAIAGLVLSILGFAALAVSSAVGSSVRRVRAHAKITATKAVLAQVEVALNMYEIDIGEYPTRGQGLAALTAKPDYEDEAMGDRWHGPYLKNTPKDAWGNELVYRPAGEPRQVNDDGTPVRPYRLYSKGPDGREDTDDDVKLEHGADV